MDSEWKLTRIAQAWALVRKDGLSGKIGAVFLRQHGVM